MTEKPKASHLRGLPDSRTASKTRNAVPHEPEQLRLDLPFAQLIDIPTLAARLGTSVRHIRRQINERKIPYVKVGHLVRFDVQEIAKWLQEHRFGLGDPPAAASGQ